MAKQPTPAFGLHEQRTAPQAQGATFARQQDISSGLGGIAASLSRAGAAVQNYQEVELGIEQLAQQRREDDARIVVTQRMAEFRREANELRRTVFNEAPDGWRGVDETFAKGYSELQQRYLQDPNINTDEARALLEEQTFIFGQSAFDTVAEGREQARGQWQADTTRAAIDAGGNALIADPSQYEATRVDALEAIAGISDANLRRDTTEYMEESYSRYAIAGLIQTNPRETLNALRDPEAEGAFARLSPAARAQAIGQAEAEIERRAARWRASVLQLVSAAESRWEMGLDAPNAPSVETVRAAHGPDRALQYEARREMSTQFGTLANRPVQELRAIVADANPRDNERDEVLHRARRQAAATILEQRAEDPMEYQIRRGLVQNSDIVDAMNRNDWGLVNGILQNRAAATVENSRVLGTAPLPLSRLEANLVGERVRAMPAEARGRFMRNAAAWMGRDSVAYRAFAAQIFPDSPASAYAGYLTGAGGERGAADAALILRGEDILGGRQSGGDGASGAGGRNRLVEMPEEDVLARAWRQRVGDAYAGVDADAQGNRVAEAQAYEAFRAAYAGLVERSGRSGEFVNSNFADRAAEIATGGVVRWNGGETLRPAGMSNAQFTAGVREGFSRWSVLAGENPSDYNLRAVELTEAGARYAVLDGDEPVRSPSGRPVEIEVRRPRR